MLVGLLLLFVSYPCILNSCGLQSYVPEEELSNEYTAEVDQFLEDLLDIGIPADSIVRLGSKTTQRTAPLLLSKQHSSFKRSRDAWRIIDDL